MNRREIFRALAVAPAAILPAAKPEPKGTTVQLPPVTSIKPGEHITVFNNGRGYVTVLR